MFRRFDHGHQGLAVRLSLVGMSLAACLTFAMAGPTAAAVKADLWGPHSIACDPPSVSGDRANVHGFVIVKFRERRVKVLVQAESLQPNTEYRVNIVQRARDCSMSLFNGSFTTDEDGKGTLKVREDFRKGGTGVVVKVDLPGAQAFGSDHIPEPS
jgi:hypothetical protein